jgi:hypothetical protein
LVSRDAYEKLMETAEERRPAVFGHRRSAPARRFVLAWVLMIGSLVGFWCCRPWLGVRAFGYGQGAVLLVTWKIVSLISLPREAWARLTPLRLLVYCIWCGMQPLQFQKGQVTAAGAPVPSAKGILLNAVTGSVLLWLVPHALPAATPFPVRFWIALIGRSFLSLFAGLDVVASIFRLFGFPVERVMDYPIAATTLGEFWGRRWNRIVSGMLREVIFLPMARWAGARVALLAVFLYSGLYHEVFSFMVGSGYGRPFLYFVVQYIGVAIENSRPARRLLRGHAWVGRAWTAAVVLLPIGLFLHPGFIHRFLVPWLEQVGVPGLQR